MKEFLEFWPVFLFTFGLFTGGIALSVGLTLWISGKLAEQDGKRIEIKEAILKELRETRHTLYTRLDMQHSILDEKIDALTNRMTKVETIVASRPWPGGRRA